MPVRVHSIPTYSLLLATALRVIKRQHCQKIDADYQGDLINIYNAEIDALLHEVMHLYEAEAALGSGNVGDGGFATIPMVTKAQKKQGEKQIEGLAAWSASQDEGEIPYQVLAAKEVQLLRAKSIKQGQLSAQSYENIITPILAELDAYGKGGITTQTIVQALGFIGVITSTAVK